LDEYGFRNGDRVIQLFADILRKNLPHEFFKAHIGGDDFFTGVKCTKENESQYIIFTDNIVKKFTHDAREFYSLKDRDRGYIISKDRDENEKTFALLSVSASMLIIHRNSDKRCLKNINNILAIQKKVAKNESTHISRSCLL